MRHDRLKQMEEYLRQNEICSLDVLCKVFSISKVTVRRDIDELCKTGITEKINTKIGF